MSNALLLEEQVIAALRRILVPGVVSAVPEDVSRYLEKAVVTTDEAPLAEEELSTIQHESQEEPANGNDSDGLGRFPAEGGQAPATP